MKMKWIALALDVMLLAVPVSAEWGEGLSAAKPYQGSPEVDLNATMGYILMYPRTKMPAEHFCDVLQIYLPREDIVAGEGSIHLYDENGEMMSASFSDSEKVEIRPLDEEEMTGLMWGGGRCIVIHLPVSLTLGGKYYVTMDQGCFTAADGKVVSLGFSGNETWVPVLNGDFGISALRYTVGTASAATGGQANSGAAPAAAQAEGATVVTAGDSGQQGGATVVTAGGSGQQAESTQTTSPQTEAAQKEAKADDGPEEYTLSPKKGDSVKFHLELGGDAVDAVAYSENGSVLFEKLEYTESADVVASVVNEPVQFGVVFQNANGDVLDIINVSK